MTKICSKCNRVMEYEPYFKTYLCRQCGNEVAVKITPRHGSQIVRVKGPKSKKIVAIATAVLR